MRKERLNNLGTRSSLLRLGLVGVLAPVWLATGPTVAAAQQGNAYGPPVVSVGPWHAAGEGVGGGAPGGPEDRLIRARTQIALGNPRRAIELLTDSAETRSGTVEVQVLLAHAHFALEDFPAAAEQFARAASGAASPDRPVLLARAGDAAERAGLRTAASAHYRSAADLGRAGNGWLLLRAARVSDHLDVARLLLAGAPAAGRHQAMQIEAEASVFAGDTVRALELYASMGLYSRGAQLSLAAGHDALARELVYAALERRSEPQARDAAALAFDEFAPTNSIEVDQLARALARHGRARDAAGLVAEWVAGDSSDTMLKLLGEMREAAGDRWGALSAYEAAAAGRTAVGGDAEYRRIRLMVRMQRTNPAIRALQGFRAAFPDHSRRAWADYLLGDLWWDVRFRSSSDSVFAVVSREWPESQYAALARYRLAARALLRADTATAIERFQRAADGGGDQARSSRFQLAMLLRATGQSERARTALVQLAREDSVGYYGMIAREEAGLPLPVFAAPAPHAVTAEVQEILATLDFLDAAGFVEEAEALVDYAIRDAQLAPDAQLGLAEGLIERNRSIRAIRLGWTLTRHFSLNHPRVIRIIFPFPNRDLVEAEAAKFDLDPFLVAGMIRQESAFDVDAVSRAGARGLMQLMPATARGLARRQGLDWANAFLTVADANVHVGTAHLAALLRQYEGTVEHALAAYNAGGRPVRRWLRYPEVGDRHRWIERVSYTETRGYLKTVLRNRDLYRALYGNHLIP